METGNVILLIFLILFIAFLAFATVLLISKRDKPLPPQQLILENPQRRRECPTRRLGYLRRGRLANLCSDVRYPIRPIYVDYGNKASRCGVTKLNESP